MPNPDLSRNFRATAWSWYCACANCGGRKNHPEVMMERRRARGILRPPKLCPSCVMTVILKWAHSPDEEES